MKPSEFSTVAQAALSNNFPLLVKGSPGIGKSDIVASVCKSLGLPLIIRHPVTEESIDYKGLPGFADGIAKFFPFADFHALMTADKPLAVFYDDLGQAPDSVKAALMQVTLAREIAGKPISPHVRFIAATNSRKDNAGVTGMLTALTNRFTVVELEADPAQWVQWALRNGMPTELCAFIRFRPDLLSVFDPAKAKDIAPFSSPRSVAQVGKWLSAGVISLPVWAGAAGEAFAVEFMGFYQTYKALAGLPDSVIQTPHKAAIPDNPATLYALTGALAHRAKDCNFDAICTYGERLAQAGKAEFQTALVHDCTGRHPELKETRAFIKWAADKQDTI